MYACRHALKQTLRTRTVVYVRKLHSQGDLLENLQARGLVSDVTRPDILKEELCKGQQVVYAGIDPTAKSLHVGHLLPLLSLLHFQLGGHQIIPLIGGATGLIGDPSGRSTERPLSTEADVQNNVSELAQGVRRFFASASQYAARRGRSSATILQEPKIRNNIEWLRGMGLLEFLRTVGIHARINTMMARDSVRTRLETQQGISFTEFTYQLMQAYDFLMLFKTAGCTIQVGGSDQWGNIIAGIDLINKVNATTTSDTPAEKGFGVVTPLLTTATGEKFGKSAGNAVSLDERATNVFDFYQFFLRSADADVGRYLKMFTLLPLEDIEHVMSDHTQSPEKRSAQHLLAGEVTEMVHGEAGLRRARAATAVLYDHNFAELQVGEIVDSLRGMPFVHTCEPSDVMDVPLVKLAARFKIATSNGAARQLVSAKGLYINNEVVTESTQTLDQTNLLEGRLAILRAGKQKQAVIVLNRTP